MKKIKKINEKISRIVSSSVILLKLLKDKINKLNIVKKITLFFF